MNDMMSSIHWDEVKLLYPKQWVVIEAIDAKTEENKRIIEQLYVIDNFFEDSQKAMQKYKELHKNNKEKEYYVVHTERPELNITILNRVRRF